MLGKMPMFEPDEETKALIASMFEEKQEEKKQDKQYAKPEIKRPPTRHRVKLPEPATQSEEQQQIGKTLAQEELDIIHDAFMEFSEQTSHTVVYGYLYTEILKLTEAFQDMESLITDSIDTTKLSEDGLVDYEKLRIIRKRILNDVYRKYETGK